MPRKIENPLISGIPAKIYMLCYLGNETGYSLAQKIYSVTEGIPPTARIYPWTKIMIKDKFLRRIDNTFRALPEPLGKQLITLLEDNMITLNATEKKMINRILNSDHFRHYVKMAYENFQPHYNVDFGDKQISYTKEFNALEFMGEAIGKICTLCLIQKRFGVQIFSESDEVTGQYVKTMGGNGKMDYKKIQDGVNSFRNIARDIILLPEPALGKFSKLWSDSKDIIYSYYVDYHEKGRKKK